MSRVKILTGLTLALFWMAGGLAYAKIYLNAPDGRKVELKEGTRQPDLSRYRSPLESKVVDRRFYTNEAMYLANEEFLSGDAFLPGRGQGRPSHRP